jgi:hypothetical protein
VRVVCDLPNRKLIDDRRIDPHRRSVGGPVNRNAASEERTAKEARMLQEAASVERSRHDQSPHNDAPALCIPMITVGTPRSGTNGFSSRRSDASDIGAEAHRVHIIGVSSLPPMRLSD